MSEESQDFNNQIRRKNKEVKDIMIERYKYV